jgi:Zn-dependent oligopeptidase
VKNELLSFRNVETMYHEFGHCIHHILASTCEFKHTGGTRGELDFVEVCLYATSY